MASISDVIASRRKSIATLQAEVAEWDAQAAKLPAGAARASIEGIAKVKRQRLVKLQGELEALAQLAADPRQVELPKAKR